MPMEQPLAQDLMQEALSSSGSHVERFLSPTIFSVKLSLCLAGWIKTQVHKWPAQTGRGTCECAFKFSHFLFRAQLQ